MLLPATHRSVLISLTALTAIGLTACEPMEPSSTPFAAVEVETSGSGGGVAAAEIDASEQGFDDPVEFSSDDLKPQVEETASPEEPVVQVGAALKPAEQPVAVESAPRLESTGAPAPLSVAAAVALTAEHSTEWPVRLVRTHLDEQPPSATLALPDGRRVVVSAGDMVPERGLVVMAIGRDRVHLAAVSTRGDHATVVPMELTSQY